MKWKQSYVASEDEHVLAAIDAILGDLKSKDVVIHPRNGFGSRRNGSREGYLRLNLPGGRKHRRVGPQKHFEDLRNRRALPSLFNSIHAFYTPFLFNRKSSALISQTW